jgi:hypothetical protein
VVSIRRSGGHRAWSTESSARAGRTLTRQRLKSTAGLDHALIGRYEVKTRAFAAAAVKKPPSATIRAGRDCRRYLMSDRGEDDRSQLREENHTTPQGCLTTAVTALDEELELEETISECGKKCGSRRRCKISTILKKCLTACWSTEHDHPHLREENRARCAPRTWKHGRNEQDNIIRNRGRKGEVTHIDDEQRRTNSMCSNHREWRHGCEEKKEKATLENYPQTREEKFEVLPTQEMRSKEWKSSATAGRAPHARKRSGRSSASREERRAKEDGIEACHDGQKARAKSHEHPQLREERDSPRSRHGSEEEGRRGRKRPSASAGKKVHVFHGDDSDHRGDDMGGVISRRLARASRSWKSQDTSGWR